MNKDKITIEIIKNLKDLLREICAWNFNGKASGIAFFDYLLKKFDWGDIKNSCDIEELERYLKRIMKSYLKSVGEDPVDYNLHFIDTISFKNERYVVSAQPFLAEKDNKYHFEAITIKEDGKEYHMIWEDKNTKDMPDNLDEYWHKPKEVKKLG